MEVNTKKIGQDVLKFTVLGGSAVIAVNSIMQLTKSTDLKSAIMPAITLLVGVSAFSYAMTADKVGFVPELNKNEVSGEEDKSEALGRVSSFDVNSGRVSNAIGTRNKTVRGFFPAGTTMPTVPNYTSGRLIPYPKKSAGDGKNWCCSQYETKVILDINHNPIGTITGCVDWTAKPIGNPCSTAAII